MPKSFAGRFGTVEYTDPLPSLPPEIRVDQQAKIYACPISGSIVRPDFYEIIPTQIVGELFDIKGNDSLRHSKADNIDLRYEFYPGGADQVLLGASIKYKDPIEYAVVRNGGPSAQYLMPENFGNAHNYGFEAVFTKFFGMFGVSANYTYTKSRITTTKQYFYRDPTLGLRARS